jgi:hypothetical protein
MRTGSAVLIIVAVNLSANACSGQPASGPAGPQLNHRCWQFQDADRDWLNKAIPLAAAAGMNRVQLSHNIIMSAEQVWEGPGAQDRLDLVRQAATLARRHHLQVDVWTHELSGIPKDRFRDEKGRPVLSPELWQWVREKYDRFFRLVPGCDGLVLTFAETQYSVYTDKVVSDLTRPQRVARLIEVMSEACAAHGKLLIVRTFVYEPAEIGFMHEALSALSGSRGRPGNIVIMTKCVPHDWTPFYPFDPLLGNVAGFPQVVEIDLGQEFTGLSRILHCEPGYVKYVMDYARGNGVIGGVARVERLNNHALGTPNEVNIHAFSRLLHDPAPSAEALWTEWATTRYGPRAAPPVIRALRRTFDVTNLTYFPLEQWVTNHSLEPTWRYAYGHITERQNAKWIPSPRQLAARDELLHPDGDTLIKINHEKDLARRLADLSLADLEEARPALVDADYRELRHYLEFGRDVVEVFRAHNLAMFTQLCLEGRKAGGNAGAEELASLRSAVERQIRVLEELAGVMEQRYGKDVYPGTPRRLRDFATEVRARLQK